VNALPTALVDSIRDELLRLVQGDLDKNLVAIGKLSARARDLFMVFKNPEAAVKGRRQQYSSDEDGEDSYSSGYSSGGVLMPNPQTSAETFGAKAIREIIGAIPGIMNSQNETPSALIIAASLARDRGMIDLSAEIEKKLVGHALDGDRPIDKDRMRNFALETPEKLKKRYLGIAVGAITGIATATPPSAPAEDAEEEEEVEEEILTEPNANFFISTDDLNVSVRIYNCLRNANIMWIGELVQWTKRDMLKMKNFGRKSLKELEAVLQDMELSFEMKIDNWPDMLKHWKAQQATAA